MKLSGKINIRPKSECKWDLVSLGEIMLRLDPGDIRIRTARNFRVWEGGGEYNVARGLTKCFGLNTAVVTGIAKSEIGYLLLDLINQGGVDTSYIKWFSYDGIGRYVRVGLNFTERGFGVRGALGVYDRVNSAASKLKVGDIDWNKIFREDGARWFHTGGIFVALSDTSAGVVKEAVKVARENGTIVSYDLNYRQSLWETLGGSKKAIEVNREIVKYVDVVIGNEEDFTVALGFEVKGLDKELTKLEPDNFKRMIKQCVSEYPDIKAVATTLRGVKTASINDWGVMLYYNGKFFQAIKRENLEIFDRIGGGDSFVSGLIYGFLSDKPPEIAVKYGAVHGALAMTTPGDTSMASLSEVEKIVFGGGARISR